VTPASETQPRALDAVQGRRPRISPLARGAAERLGVDIASVRGTGINGAITAEDVERAARPAPGTPAPVLVEEPGGQPAPAQPADRAASLRRGMAAAMSRSHREIPHYYLAVPVDLSTTLEWLEQANRERPVQQRVIPAALFVRAVALATQQVPELNGHWIDGRFHPGERAHVGFAVSVPGGGLIAPAVLDADRKPLVDVMRDLRTLVGRARAGSLRSSEVSEGTITVTSLGERGGVDTVFGLINPPQVALVGFGSIVERPWAERGMVAARRQVHVSLSADHRTSEGHRGAAFLAAVDRLLRDPEQL
jgi:pyruvate dehydrogenase E2 component (dihydrolipoamide acetyltransferase)